MITLETEKRFEELKNGRTVFELIAGWCPDCEAIRPNLPKLEKEYSDFKFVSVDRNKFIDLAIESDIVGVPSSLVCKGGELMRSYIGKERKPVGQIGSFLSQYV